MEVPLNQDTRKRDEDESNFRSKVDTDMNNLGLKPRRRHLDDVIVPVSTKADNGDGEPLENDAYLNIYGGVVEDLNIRKILNSVRYDENDNGEIETANNDGGEVIEEKSKQIGKEIIEEEVVELEFENAIPKLHTHTMHCPYCKRHITKVTLRRKIIQPLTTEQRHEPMNLLGCLSCLGLFIPTENGGFKSISIWNNYKPTSDALSPAGGDGIVREDGNCFSIFKAFQPKSSPPNQEGENSGPDLDVKQREEVQSSIDIPHDTTIAPQVPRPRSPTQDSTSFEILKSIIYGGLMEVIASLSIVASAAAGGTTTLNIIALALANLIGGIFIIGHNLWDLRDDCYKFSTQQTSNEQDPRNKYKDLLGSVEHFPLHVFFAILSFIVFGVIPPVVYGYSFNETNDKDFTMVIVAVASFVCVALLAVFKAYIDRCTGFLGYVKTIMYYLTTAVTVSGVSYAAGNLAKRLIEELGLFETSSNVAMAILPEVVAMNPSLANY